MELFYIYDEEDIESSYGLFDNREAAEFVCDRITNLADSPTIKEVYTDNTSEDGLYFFVVNFDDSCIDDNCFTSLEDAIEYAADQGISYEIHGHKVNSIYSGGNDSVDENGEIIKPDDDDMDSSFYNLAQELKENEIEFVYFDQIYEEGD